MNRDKDIPVRKIRDDVWEVPQSYKDYMRVPARIYAAEGILDKMKSDLTLQQTINVASLPGIEKYSMVMPDGHQGYGFPIGGVAATDFEEGVISPGGVGYDINCLPGSTKVLSPLGYWIEIEKVLPSESVVVLDQWHAKPTEVVLTLNRREDRMLKIRTAAGFELSLSKDHPVLTRQHGMKEARNLSLGEAVGIHPFEGVEYARPPGFEIVSGKEFSKVVAAELKKRRLIPLCADNAKLPYLMKIFGYLLGEGTVYDKNVFFYGDRENLEEIKGDIRVLGYTGGIYERQRMHSLKGYEFCRKETCLKVSARSLAELLFALGYPRGKKTETDLHVPKWLLRLPKWMKRLFLATYFGAEMSKSKSSNGYNFCMPEVKRSKSKGKKRGSDEFLNELQEMLTELGVSSTVSIAEETGDRRVYRLLVKANPDNFIRLLSRVGYEYNRKRRQFAMAAIVYTRLKIAAIRERERLRAEIRTLRGKKRINELEEIYRGRLNRRFIERSLYEETTGARPPFGFIKYEEFLQNFSDGEVVYDKIVEMGEYKFNERVYDFTVKDKSHNFVADCFVVSNCGVRLIRTNLMEEDVRPHLSEILDGLFEYIPAGLGLSGKERLSYSQLDEVLRGGTEWCIENGYGWEEDIERTEEGGRLEAANPEKIDEKSKKRGVPQLGTLGSGNHFLEVGVVDDIFDVPLAKAYGINEKGQVIVLIHTGGRGFSHGVCTYYLRNFEREMSKNATLSQILGLERQLACAYLSSDTGMDYFEAMCACANYAFANRQLATHWVRKVFEDVLRSSAEDMEIKLVYDIAHNIAKEEEHVVNGKRKKLCVHRKGATRAFPADDERLPPFYRNIGQPVLIPGSMGTRSFLAVGTEVAKEETFGSCAHGSGREMSRTAAMRKYRGIEVKEELAKRNIIVKTRERTKRDVRKKKGIPFDKYGELAEEVAAAYKDPEVVIRSCEVSGIAKRVAAVRGIGVIKG